MDADRFYYKVTTMLPRRLISMCILRALISLRDNQDEKLFLGPNDLTVLELLNKFDPHESKVRLRLIK